MRSNALKRTDEALQDAVAISHKPQKPTLVSVTAPVAQAPAVVAEALDGSDYEAFLSRYGISTFA